jgi:hypothetical protein
MKIFWSDKVCFVNRNQSKALMLQEAFIFRGVNMQLRAAPQRMKIGELGGRPPRPPACGAIYKGVYHDQPQIRD